MLIFLSRFPPKNPPSLRTATTQIDIINGVILASNETDASSARANECHRIRGKLSTQICNDDVADVADAVLFKRHVVVKYGSLNYHHWLWEIWSILPQTGAILVHFAHWNFY